MMKLLGQYSYSQCQQLEQAFLSPLQISVIQLYLLSIKTLLTELKAASARIAIDFDRHSHCSSHPLHPLHPLPQKQTAV